MRSNETIASEKAFLIENVLVNGSHLISDLDKERLKIMRKEKVLVPHIFVSSGSNSRILGSASIIEAIHEYCNDNQVEAMIMEVGDFGIQNFEPVMHVQLPGKCRVGFRNVRMDNVGYIMAGVLNNYLPEEYIIAQSLSKDLEAWDNVASYQELDMFAHQKKLISRNCGIIEPTSIVEYIARGGFKSFVRTIRRYTFEEVCDLTERSGLRGRGGAGYNTGQKWKEALGNPGDQKYLICNADESDPGSFKERFLIEGDPFRLIEGIAIAAYAIGARKAYIYIRNRYSLAIQRLEQAIMQAAEYGLLGHNIMDSGFNLDIMISRGGGAMVCGEETAIIKSIEGKRPMPRPRPPYPSKNGLFGKPTIVNNPETLMNIPDILLHGAGWFHTIGKKNNYGTKIIGLTGRVRYKGVAEIPLGMPLRDVIMKIGQGLVRDDSLKAVHIGGASGGTLPAEEAGLPFTFEAIREKGGLMGSGVITVLSRKNCIVDFVKYMMDIIQRESCGKCIPCREGSKRMYEILSSITKKPLSDSGHQTLERFKGVIQLENLSTVMQDASLCGMGKTAPNIVLSTLNYFKEEYEDHIFDRNCKAGVCKDLKVYYIDVDKCTGCMACAQKCPENAIVGTKKHPFFIVEDKCTGCGICFETCKFNAITAV